MFLEFCVKRNVLALVKLIIDHKFTTYHFQKDESDDDGLIKDQVVKIIGLVVVLEAVYIKNMSTDATIPNQLDDGMCIVTECQMTSK